jgi:hypothetical protein
MVIREITTNVVTDNRGVIFEINSNPTFTAGTGTAITEVNMLIGSATAPVADVRLGPTLTTNGAGFKERVVWGRGSPVEWIVNGSIVIPPGASITIRGNPFTNGTLASVDISWAEVAL